MIKIISHDSVWSSIDREGYLLLNDFLSYKKVYWQNNGFKKVRKEYTKHLIAKNGKEYIFLTGLVPKVIDFLKKKGFAYHYSNNIPVVNYDEVNLPGIKLRDYQEEAVYAAIHAGRGVLQMATGTGKSIVIGGVISAFSQERILVLCHTKAIITQLYNDFEKWGFSPTMANSKNIVKKRVMVSTIQTFRRIVLEYSDFFDIVIADEAHHLKDWESKNYGYSLTRLSAPVKIGVTATLHNDKESMFSLEGLLGPVVYQYDIKEAEEAKILAVPTIHIYDTDCPQKVIDLKSYQQQYRMGITKNEKRNKLIVAIAINFIKKGNSILILVKQIEHGKNIQREFSQYGKNIPFVEGVSKQQDREIIKSQLKKKKKLCVISSDIWTEGTDLPSLEILINASGGKSDLVSLQRTGRVLRSFSDKEKVKVIDFYDQGKYLKKHSKQRIRLYQSKGWKVKFENNSILMEVVK